KEAGIKLGYQQPTTEALKKYGKRLIPPKRIHEYGGYAFRHLRSGVPRPVHLDFPAEVYRARFEKPGDLEYYFDKARYRTTAKPHPGPKDVVAAVDLLKQGQRPIIGSRNGVFFGRGLAPLKEPGGERPH